MVENLLQTDPEWKSVYLELQDVNTLITKTDLMEEPSMRFTRNVMEEVGKYKVAPATSSYINNKIIFGIAGFFILAIVAILAAGIAQIDFSQPATELQKYQVDWSKYLTSPLMNGFLFIDAIVGLLLLDRYLRRRNEKLRDTAA